MPKKFNRIEYYRNVIDRYLETLDENFQQKSKISYVINEEKRTVVAIMKGCRYDVIDIMRKLGLDNIPHDKANMSKFMLNSIYRGKAKCSQDDEWDVQTGMKIARTRMLRNYYLSRTKALIEVENALARVISDIGSYIDYSESRFLEWDNECEMY